MDVPATGDLLAHFSRPEVLKLLDVQDGAPVFDSVNRWFIFVAEFNGLW